MKKFRAWWIEQETMCDVEVIGFGEGAITVSNENTTYEHLGLDEVELMQYTGLKDKNGVEIYEGDVVDYFKLSYSTIEWKNGGFIIKRLIDCEYETMQNRIAEIEVIGNVYENPELLEVAE